jgi:hypothetical protein
MRRMSSTVGCAAIIAVTAEFSTGTPVFDCFRSSSPRFLVLEPIALAGLIAGTSGFDSSFKYELRGGRVKASGVSL